MKNLDQIWQEHISINNLSVQTLRDLIWHIEHDLEPGKAIVMATDIIMEKPNDATLNKLIPYLAGQFDHEDDHVREVTVDQRA